ncbi:MAG: hypothetical protein WAX38_00950 [Minisyncoccia bacterium]
MSGTEFQTGAVASTFPALIGYIVSIIEIIIPMMVAAAVVLYFYNAGQGIFKSGSNAEAKKKLKENMLWGAIILFVMISVWGLVGLLEQTFLAGGAY